MMSISVEAAEARDSLSDDREIVNTYEVKLNSLSCQVLS
jgi:exocyst complex component 3